MAKPDFTSVLDMSPSEIERPKPLPPGDYLVTIKSYIQDKTSRKETPFIEFSTTPVEALGSVDEDWLREALTTAGGGVKKLSDMSIRIRFYDTPDAAYRLKKFLLDDVQLEDDGSSIGQLVEAATNAQVIVNIKHRSLEGDVFIDVTGTSPVNPPERKKAARR
jgi:hypothetical protein